MSADSSDDVIRALSDDDLWRELLRRGAVAHCGYCYPAMCTDKDATELVHEHGYEFGPWQLIEIGERLAEPPQWPIYAQVPPAFRNVGQ